MVVWKESTTAAQWVAVMDGKLDVQLVFLLVVVMAAERVALSVAVLADVMVALLAAMSVSAWATKGKSKHEIYKIYRKTKKNAKTR